MNDGSEGCRYCGRTPRTKEHALAKQLAELLPQPVSMTAERIQLDSDGETLLSSWTTTTPASVVVKDFCTMCNGGFMNSIDSAIKDEFAQLVNGSPIVLDGPAIARWAAWATKQALSYQAAYPEDLSDPGDYTRFYGLQEPLPHSFIHLGRSSAPLPWVHFHARRPMWLTELFGEERRCGLQVWIAVYGHLVVRVILVHEEQAVSLVMADDGRLVRLHPDPATEVDLGALPPMDERHVAEVSKLSAVIRRAAT